MYRFVSLGCSLTEQFGYIDYFNSKYNLKIHNIAEAAGSNGLQVLRLNNLLYKGLVGKNTTLIWQITSLDRHFQLFNEKFVDPDVFVDSQKASKPPFTIEEIVPFNVTGINPLCHSLYWRHKNEFIFKLNLQNILCEIFKYSKIVKNIILHFGWADLLGLTKSEFDNAMVLINSCPNITVIPVYKSIVDWCKSNNMPFEKDDWHPTRHSYEVWGQNILEPILIKEIKDV